MRAQRCSSGMTRTSTSSQPARPGWWQSTSTPAGSTRVPTRTTSPHCDSICYLSSDSLRATANLESERRLLTSETMIEIVAYRKEWSDEFSQIAPDLREALGLLEVALAKKQLLPQ